MILKIHERFFWLSSDRLIAPLSNAYDISEITPTPPRASTPMTAISSAIAEDILELPQES
jgi:hypothetical protein